MKLSQAEQILNTLSHPSFQEIKGKIGVRIARNKRMIVEELQEYFQYKNDIIGKYGKDGIIDPMSENYQKAVEELQPLLDEDVEFNFKTISYDDLEECENITEAQAEILMQYFEV